VLPDVDTPTRFVHTTDSTVGVWRSCSVPTSTTLVYRLEAKARAFNVTLSLTTTEFPEVITGSDSVGSTPFVV
jgi:hypothetical protein